MHERTEPAPVRRLRALSQTAFADFCAELWAARGGDVRRTDGRLSVSRDGERVVVLPCARRFGLLGRPDAHVDVVVTPFDSWGCRRLAARLDARLVGPSTLDSLLRYGVDRTVADDIFERHLGTTLSAVVDADARSEASDAASRRWPAASSASTSPPSPSPSPWLSWRPESGTVTTAAAVLGVVCLVLAGAFAGVYTPAVDGSRAQSTPSSGSDAVEASATPARNAASVPGFADGRLDAMQLALAHAQAVEGRSYRLLVRHAGTSQLGGDRRWRSAWHHAVVADERRYLYSVLGYVPTGTDAGTDGTVDPNAGDTDLIQFTEYADGGWVYRRTDGPTGTVYDRQPVRLAGHDGVNGVFADQAGRYLVRYFTTSEARVEQPTWSHTPYRIVATGDPQYVDGNVTDYEASAMVDERGFVSAASVTYTRTVNGTAREVRFRLEYAAVGETTVKPPVWYDDARAATNGTATTTTATTNSTETVATVNNTETVATAETTENSTATATTPAVQSR